MAHVFYAPDSDPAMQRAKQQARDTFRYFWRELAWEQRRIVPALDLAAVKVAFRDDAAKGSDGAAPTEEMWLGDITFDGKHIRGTLLNTPNELRSIAAGDRVDVALGEISDWMYAADGEVYGAFTVQLLRLGMKRAEREAHDEAWGLAFGDPKQPRLLPSNYPRPPAEHPMAMNMGKSLTELVQKSPAQALAHDETGFTLLHHLALAGSPSGVRILLAHGADPKALTRHGMTAQALAESLGWTEVAEILRQPLRS